MAGKRSLLVAAETLKGRFVLRITECSQDPVTGRATCSQKRRNPEKKIITFTYSELSLHLSSLLLCIHFHFSLSPSPLFPKLALSVTLCTGHSTPKFKIFSLWYASQTEIEALGLNSRVLRKRIYCCLDKLWLDLAEPWL